MPGIGRSSLGTLLSEASGLLSRREKGSGHCPVPRRLPSAAASHLSSSGATLRTSDCATRFITGHVSPPSAIPSVAPDILRCANVATRTDVLSVVSRTDCLPWHVSFCSDRRCLIRTLANLPHNRGIILQSAPKPRVATVGFLSRLERPFLPFSNPRSFGKFFCE